MNILQHATARLNSFSSISPLKKFIYRLYSSKRHTLPSQNSMNENRSIHLGRKFQLPKDHMLMVHLQNKQILNYSLHRTCWKNNVRFSVYESSSTTKTSDSCVLFKHQHETNCGVIAAIVCDSNQECRVVIHRIHIDRYDSLIFKKKKIRNPFVFCGQLTDPPDMVIIHMDDIIVKLAYNKQDVFHIFQFPNVVEST